MGLKKLSSSTEVCECKNVYMCFRDSEKEAFTERHRWV